MFRRQRKRIGDDTILGTLYLIYLFCLCLDRHILVNDTDTTLSSHGNRHTMFGNSIHSCAHHRNVQLDLLCQPCGQIHLIRDYLRVRRYEQYVIKGNAFTNNLSHFLSSCVHLIRFVNDILLCYKL